MLAAMSYSCEIASDVAYSYARENFTYLQASLPDTHTGLRSSGFKPPLV